MTSDTVAGASRGLLRRGGGAWWVDHLVLAGIVVLTAVVTWMRVPGDHRDRVWAEDANIFLAQALDQGGWSVLFEGYAGYQHFVPRLVLALLLPVLDLPYYAVLVFAICSVLTGLTAGAVYWLSREIVPWAPARVALALSTAFIPLATQETIGNLADIHTYAMWLAPWILLYRPRTWTSSVLWAVVAWLVVATEIQAVFFLPLILFRLRSKKSWPVFGAFLAGSALQVATAVTVERATSNGPLSIPSTVMGWMINSVMPLVTADPDTIRAWVLESGVLAAVLILVPIVVAAVFVLVRGNGSQRIITVALLLGSAAIYTGSAWANSSVWFMYAEEGLENIGTLVVNIRYGVASGLMLVAVLPIAASVMRERWPRARAARWGAWVVCAVTIGALMNGSTMTMSIRDWVDRWSPAARAAAVVCADPAAPDTVTLPVAPDRSIDLSCEDVLAHSR